MVALNGLGPRVAASALPEPETVLYGRIVQVHRGREFWITNGELAMTLRTSVPEVREHRLVARVRAQADGRSSYVVRLPHQLLARGLTVAADRVPLLASGEHRVDFSRVTIDGAPVQFAPMTITDLRLTSRERSRVHRMDLLQTGPASDSDGDGAPDSWEAQHGRDPWDARDGGGLAPGPAEDDDRMIRARGTTDFAAWRAVWFPDDQRSLDVSAAEDPDADGYPNLVEYAFEQDPLQPDIGLGEAGPMLQVESGTMALRLRPRVGARDLEFRVEVAAHLGEWEETAATWNEGAAGSGERMLRLGAADQDSETPVHQFFRVRVLRR